MPGEAGGAGGTLTDLAAALEQLAIALVPGPVMPTVLAGLLLTAAEPRRSPPWPRASDRGRRPDRRAR